MSCDLIVQITTPDNLTVQIQEPDDLIVQIEKVTKIGTSTYTINFDANGTQYGFYSKHFGNITSIETTNIDSYTIDGNPVSLPQAIELNTTYLIEIVKSTSETAQIVLTVQPSEYDELINKVDFTTGDGRYTYLLGDTTANTTLLKYDNDLFTSANWNEGTETFTVNPLDATITLPTLPANGYWSRVLYVKDHYMLVSGGNLGNKDKYFCKIDIDTNIVTDLSVNINQYSQFTGGDQNMYMCTQIYDYVNNIVYYGTKKAASISKLNDVVNLNLNTFVFDDSVQFRKSAIWREERKVEFDPYQKNFFINDLILNVDNHAFYSYDYAYNTPKINFNHILNRVYHTDDSNARPFYEFDHKGNYISVEYPISGVTGAMFYTPPDKENNHFVHLCRVSIASYKHHFRKYGVQSYGYSPIYHTPAEVNCLDAMYGKNFTHLAIYEGSQRLHLYDMNVDLSVESAEFGYLDLPVKCWSLYTTRIL
jgi:hypothetical protein